MKDAMQDTSKDTKQNPGKILVAIMAGVVLIAAVWLLAGERTLASYGEEQMTMVDATVDAGGTEVRIDSPLFELFFPIEDRLRVAVLSSCRIGSHAGKSHCGSDARNAQCPL